MKRNDWFILIVIVLCLVAVFFLWLLSLNAEFGVAAA